MHEVDYAVQNGYLDFRGLGGEVPASSQASRMAWISSGCGWSAQIRLNLAVMMTRRSLAVMSAVEVCYLQNRCRVAAPSRCDRPSVLRTRRVRSRTHRHRQTGSKIPGQHHA
jgi:hypothetical protein